MFRGKESSNRIELSRLVQDLLNFGVLGSLQLWGWGGWVDGGQGWLGSAPHTRAHAHARMHTHARTCMHGKHDNSMQMAAPIGFGEIPGIPYDVIHACACMRVCTCMRVHVHVCGGDPVTTPHPNPPTPYPQGGGPLESVKIQ